MMASFSADVPTSGDLHAGSPPSGAVGPTQSIVTEQSSLWSTASSIPRLPVEQVPDTARTAAGYSSRTGTGTENPPRSPHSATGSHVSHGPQASSGHAEGRSISNPPSAAASRLHTPASLRSRPRRGSSAGPGLDAGDSDVSEDDDLVPSGVTFWGETARSPTAAASHAWNRPPSSASAAGFGYDTAGAGGFFTTRSNLSSRGEAFALRAHSPDSPSSRRHVDSATRHARRTFSRGSSGHLALAASGRMPSQEHSHLAGPAPNGSGAHSREPITPPPHGLVAEGSSEHLEAPWLPDDGHDSRSSAASRASYASWVSTHRPALRSFSRDGRPRHHAHPAALQRHENGRQALSAGARHPSSGRTGSRGQRHVRQTTPQLALPTLNEGQSLLGASASASTLDEAWGWNWLPNSDINISPSRVEATASRSGSSAAGREIPSRFTHSSGSGYAGLSGSPAFWAAGNSRDPRLFAAHDPHQLRRSQTLPRSRASGDQLAKAQLERSFDPRMYENQPSPRAVPHVTRTDPGAQYLVVPPPAGSMPSLHSSTSLLSFPGAPAASDSALVPSYEDDMESIAVRDSVFMLPYQEVFSDSRLGPAKTLAGAHKSRSAPQVGHSAPSGPVTLGTLVFDSAPANIKRKLHKGAPVTKPQLLKSLKEPPAPPPIWRSRVEKRASSALGEQLPLGEDHADLSDNKKLTAGILRTVAIMNSDCLTSVDLSGTNVTDLMMTSFVAAADKLRSISLARCDSITNECMRLLAARCNATLTAVDVSYSTRITSDGIGWLAGGPGRTSAACHRLRSLKCIACPRICTKAFTFLSWGCRSLRYICLQRNDQVTSSGLVDLFHSTKNLLVADLGRCGELDDSVLWALARGCSHLRTLSISKNKTMTDEGLIAVAVNCTELHRLKIDECTNITSFSVLALSQNCPSLQLLDANGCDAIPENSIKAAASALRFAMPSKTYLGLKPRPDRNRLYFKTRKDLIEHVSACKIQARVKGMLSRLRLKRLIAERMQAAREFRAQCKIARSYRRYLRMKGLTQEALERLRRIRIVQGLMRKRALRAFNLLAERARDKVRRNALARVVPSIQAAWRGWFVRHKSHNWLWSQIEHIRAEDAKAKKERAAVHFQRIYRGMLARRVAKKEAVELPGILRKRHEAAALIQHAVRAWSFRYMAWRVRRRRVGRRREWWLRTWKRGLYLPWIKEHNDAMLKIHAARRWMREWRQVQAMLAPLAELRARRMAARVIQRRWRFVSARNKFRHYFQTRQRSATKIQAMFRGRRVERWKPIWRRRQDALIPQRALREAIVADRGRRHRMKLARKEHDRDSASSASSASWSESETDSDMDQETYEKLRKERPLARIGRRRRPKVRSHMDPNWTKERAGRPWLDMRSKHEPTTFANDDGTRNDANDRGRQKRPSRTLGVSNLDCPPKGPVPQVPELPIQTALAPDGDDQWDGTLEDIDRDPDGYQSGRSLVGEGEPELADKLALGQLSDRSGVADLATRRLLDKDRPGQDGTWPTAPQRMAYDSLERLRQKRRHARRLKLARGKRTDWQWQENRAHQRRARQRRKYRRDKIKARQDRVAAAKALGREPSSSDEGKGSDASAYSSDYERKGVTMPSKFLEIDYGYGPDHPVSRGAAPKPGDRGKVVRLVEAPWHGFGVERNPASVFAFKKMKDVRIDPYPLGKGGPVRGTLIHEAIPASVVEHDEDLAVVQDREAFFQTLNKDTTLDRWNAAIVGMRIKVYWDRANKWFAGTIIKYNPEKGRHKILYDDEDYEWLDIVQAHDRILAGPDILKLTEDMKRDLGIPLDVTKTSVTISDRYHKLAEKKRSVAKTAKPWIPPWEAEAAMKKQQEEEEARRLAEERRVQKEREAAALLAAKGQWHPMSLVRPPTDADLVKKGRRGSAVAEVFMVQQLRDHYAQLEKAAVLAARKRMLKHVPDVDKEEDEETGPPEGSVAHEVFDHGQDSQYASTAYGTADALVPYSGGAVAPYVGEDDSASQAVGHDMGAADEEEPETYEEYEARKLERERQQRQEILFRKTLRHGAAVVRDGLRLGPMWTRHKADPTETEGGNESDAAYYWLNEDTGQSVWEDHMLYSLSTKTTNEEVVDSAEPSSSSESEESSSEESSVGSARYSSGSTYEGDSSADESDAPSSGDRSSSGAGTRPTSKGGSIGGERRNKRAGGGASSEFGRFNPPKSSSSRKLLIKGGASGRANIM